MTDVTPKTIQIFLPQGTPRGIKLAEITSRTVQATLVPRASIELAGKRSETKSVGVYLLLSSGDQDETSAYVGEAEDCYKRILQHNSSKEFWELAIVFTSQKQQFTKSHVRYLEWLCHQKISETGRANLKNTVIPGKAYVPEPVEADLLDVFDTIRILASTLGFPIFEPLVISSPETVDDTLFIKTKRVDASGLFTAEGFVLFQGSLCSKSVSKSLSQSNMKRRSAMVESGLLVSQGDYYELSKNHLFSSPSAAGAVVLGRENNGWSTWKYANGKTLDEVNRSVEASDPSLDA
jgi:hypothetical protein